jgi:hypothetical protein
MVGGPDGEQPLRMEGEFETGRPPGLVEGADLDFTFVASIGPMELPSGQRFEWRLWIDDLSEGDWSRAFSTRRAT